MPKSTTIVLFFFVFVCGLGGILTGCGSSRGGTVTSETGRATLSVRWPEATRLIPFASNSIRVRVTRNSVLVGESLLVRPSGGGTARATFDRLPIGNVVFTATALPNAEGTGVAQAQAQTTVAIVANTVAPVTMTLASSIDRFDVSPSPLTLPPGETAALFPAARNSAGEVVITSLATVEWRSLNPGVATVEPGGLVRGVAPGTTTIEAKETESGKVGTVGVTVGASSSGEVICHAATGHCYEKVAVGRDQTKFADLRVIAESRTYQGLRGHLATLNSPAEYDFLKNSFDLGGCTLGAYQDRSSASYSEPGGGWRWVTSEPFTFAPWRGGEPNNVGGGEDYISHFQEESWNDCYDGDWSAYIIEYEAGTSGGLLLYDGFDYPAGSPLQNQNGGFGWANGWNEFGQGYTPSVITTSSLSFGNLKTTGRAFQFTSQNPIGHARVPAAQVGVDGTVLYFSILLRPLEVTGGWPDSYFGFGFSDMLMGKPGRSEFYSLEKPNYNMVMTTVRAIPNVTVFLVARVTFRAGNDLVELWVNPTPGQPLPAPMVTKSDANISMPGDIGVGGSVRCILDEYRVGTTWDSVSPVGP